jgi:hypothetical protein
MKLEAKEIALHVERKVMKWGNSLFGAFIEVILSDNFFLL